MNLEIGISGIQQITSTLNRLPDRLVNKVMRQAVRKGIKKFESAIRSNARGMLRGHGHIDAASIEKNIITKVKTYGSTATIFAIAGVARSADRAAPHAHLVEFGHRMVTRGTVERLNSERSAGRSRRTGRRGGGRVIGFVPPVPFVRRAFDANAQGVKLAIVAEIGRGAEKEVAKMAKT